MQKSDWDARYAAKDLVWGRDPNRFVAEALADAEPGRALDLACGEGRTDDLEARVGHGVPPWKNWQVTCHYVIVAKTGQHLVEVA